MASDRSSKTNGAGAEEAPAGDTLARYAPATARCVLDCGRDSAGRALPLKKQGVRELVVIAAPDEAAADAPETHPDRLLEGHLDTVALPFEPEYFDCIVCDHVLEECRDALPALKRLEKVLSPRGLMVLTFHNIQYYETVRMLAEGRWDYAGAGIMARTHIRFFTAYEIHNLLNKAGLGRHTISPLEAAAPADLPRDDEGFVETGRISLGPLNDEEYRAFLTRRYLVLAAKSSDPGPGE